MARYRITIEMIDNPADVPLITVIECETPYTLAPDMAEWVRVEIDPDAIITQVIPAHICGTECPYGPICEGHENA